MDKCWATVCSERWTKAKRIKRNKAALKGATKQTNKKSDIRDRGERNKQNKIGNHSPMTGNGLSEKLNSHQKSYL